MGINIGPKIGSSNGTETVKNDLYTNDNDNVLNQYHTKVESAGKKSVSNLAIGTLIGGVGLGAGTLVGLQLLENAHKLPKFLSGANPLRIMIGGAAVLGAIGGLLALNKFESWRADNRVSDVRDNDRPVGLPLKEVHVSGAPAYNLPNPESPSGLVGVPLLHERWREEGSDGPLNADRTTYLKPGSAVKLDGAENLEDAKKQAITRMIDRAGDNGPMDQSDSWSRTGDVLVLQLNDGSYWAGESESIVKNDDGWNYYQSLPTSVPGRNSALKAVIDNTSILSVG